MLFGGTRVTEGVDRMKVECAICGKEITTVNEHNGEMLCQECYDNHKEVIKNG